MAEAIPERPPISVSQWATRIIAAPRPLLLAFDVDGTLAPIASTPDAARVPGRSADALGSLARVPQVTVALITGRDQTSLNVVVNVEGAFLGVEHGRKVVPPFGSAPPAGLSDEKRKRLEAFRAWASARFQHPLVFLEEKEASFSVHVRPLLERDPDAARRILEEAEAGARRFGLAVRLGRALVEGEADSGSKADALASIASSSGASSMFFAGDDVTDEPAIRLAHERSGLGLFVRSPERPEAPDFATGTLDSPFDVERLLIELVGSLR